MADFVPRKFAATSINNGQRFNAKDGVTANAINAPIEAALLMQKLVENPIDDADVGSAGVPTITIEEGPNGPYFKFANFAGLVGMTPQDVLAFIAAHNDNVNAHPQLYTKIQKYVDERFEAYEPEGGTVNGSVEPVPDSIAQRDTYGSLYGKNETEYDDPVEIDTYVDADELITRDTLKKYAIPKPRGSTHLQIGVYVRTGESTELYDIDMYPQKDSINFITSGGVYRGFESYKDDLSLIFATREELKAKQDKLTFDGTPTKDSQNPVTSDGVYAEFYEFSTAYDQIIANVKSECKQYTDEQIGDIETGASGYADVTIAEITLEDDTASIKITSDTFADIDKVTDFIITFEIAKPTESNTASNPLYVKFNGITSAVIGRQVSGWAHNSYILNGTVASFCIGTSRMCIAPTALGANGTINYALGTVKNLLPATLNSIEIVPANPSELPIPAGSKIKIEGRVTK